MRMRAFNSGNSALTIGTVEQFKRHITEDVLPPLLDKLSAEAK